MERRDIVVSVSSFVAGLAFLSLLIRQFSSLSNLGDFYLSGDTVIFDQHDIHHSKKTWICREQIHGS